MPTATTRPCNRGLKLCRVCRTSRTRTTPAICSACRRHRQQEPIKLPPRDVHSVASPERIEELAALAEAGLPLTPNRREAELFRRLPTDCHSTHEYGRSIP